MMEDIAEQHEVAREVSDAISNPIAFGQDIDENEISHSSGEAATEGEDPSNSASDSVLILPYLDDLSWKLIGEKVQTMSTEDAENFANSTSFFRKLMAPQRTNFLFEKVLPLVINTVWENEGLEGMPLSDVRKCRGVCKHWNAVVDKLKSEEFAVTLAGRIRGIGDHAFQSVGDGRRCFSNLNDSLNIPKKTVQQFLQYFEVSHPANQLEGRNPFISKNLLFTIYGDQPNDLLEVLRWYPAETEALVIEDCHRFFDDISLMVSRYGHHIHSATVHTRTNQLYDNPLLLPQWLRQMPNLRKFEFKAIGVDLAELNLEEDQDVNPFPILRHLDVVDINGLPITLFRQFIRQNNHVSILTTDMLSHLEMESSNVVLQNLKKLSLSNCPEIIEKLASPQVQWHLETLCLSLPARLDYVALFTVIENKFASTLKSLTLTFDQDEEGESTLLQDLINCRLHLPELKEIHLGFDEEPACLDFLLPMKNNLELVSVTFGYEFLFEQKVTFSDGPIVQFMGFQEKMLKSNVWLLFKKLRIFHVEWQDEFDYTETRLYSREEWLENNEYI